MATLKVAIDATGAQAGAQKTKQALDSIRNASRTASQSTREFDKAQKDATGGSLKFGGALAQLGIAFSFAQVIRSTTANIVEFDRAIRELEAVTGATGAQLAALESRARDLGATTEFTAKQAADGLTFLARAGFDTQQSLDAIGATLDIATAGTLGLAEAADIASNVVSTFNLEAAQTAEVGDILVATANNANTNVQQLAEAIKFAGNVASAVGVPLEDLSAAVGVLGNRGVQASLAGTNLRGIIAGLLGPTTEAQERIRALGLTLADIDPTTKSLAEIFEAFAAAGLEASDAVAIFGRRNVGAALAFRDSTDELRNLNQEIQDADGAASDAADTVRDSLKGSIDSLKSAVSELQLVLGEGGLSGALRGTVDLATDVVRALSGSSNEFQNNEVAVRSLAAAVETLAIAAGVAGLAKALSLAKVATLGLSAALRANPIGLTITALAGAVALFDQFTAGASEAQQALENIRNDSLSFGEALEGVNEKLLRLERLEGLEQSSDTLSDRAATLSSVESSLDALADRLFSGAKENLFTADLARLFELSPELEQTARQSGRDIGTAIVESISGAIGTEGSEEFFRVTQTLEDTLGETGLVRGAGASQALDNLRKIRSEVGRELGELRRLSERGGFGGLQGSIDLNTRLNNINQRVAEALEPLVSGEVIAAQISDDFVRRAVEEAAAAAGEQADELRAQATAELNAQIAERRKALEAAATGDAGGGVDEDLSGLPALLASIARETAAAAVAAQEFDAAADASRGSVSAFSQRLRDAIEANEAGGLERRFVGLQQEADALVSALPIEEQASAAAKLNDEIKQLKRSAQFAQLGDSIGQAFGAAFEDIILGASEAKDAIEALANSIVQSLVQAFVTDQIANAISGFVASLGGSVAAGNGSTNAKGNVFAGGSVVPFAQGGVITGPVTFPMAGGATGLAGEAGTEGIFPLGRDSAGRLGVRVVGGDGRSGGTTVVNYSPRLSPASNMREQRRSTRTIASDLQRYLQRPK